MQTETFTKTLNRNDVWEIERSQVDDDGETYEEVLATADTETLADKIVSILQGNNTDNQLPRIKMTCKYCGSENIRKDAFAAWDIEKQDWVLSSVYDSTTCEDCGNESNTLANEETI